MSDKIYDAAFKTMANKMPRLMIPLVNEAFGTRYQADERISQLPLEFHVAGRKVSADSLFTLGAALYHFELQSTDDGRMALRMLEYDLAIAFAHAGSEGSGAAAIFPRSCVVYLRDAPASLASTARRDGESLDMSPVVFDASAYGPVQIAAKGLSILAPFQVLRLDRELRRGAPAEYRKEAFGECADALRAVLDMGEPYGGQAVYNEVHKLALDIVDWAFRDHDDLRREARDAMEAEILELVSERHERELREARQAGYFEGVEQGEEQGLEKGREEGETRLLRRLLESDAIDAAQIAEATGMPLAEIEALASA